MKGRKNMASSYGKLIIPGLFLALQCGSGEVIRENPTELSVSYDAQVIEPVEAAPGDLRRFYTSKKSPYMKADISLSKPPVALSLSRPVSVVYRLTVEDGKIIEKRLIKSAPEPYLLETEKALKTLDLKQIEAGKFSEREFYVVLDLQFLFGNEKQ